MFALLNRLSVRNRIWGIVLIFIGSIVLGSALDVMLLRDTLRQEKESTIRQAVESVHGVLVHFESLERNGTLTREAAQAATMATVKGLRYNGTEYFWINDDQTPPTMVMHPIMPALDGQKLGDEKYNRATSLRSAVSGPFVATDGRKNLFEAFVEVVAETGHGYVAYQWPKALAGGGSTPESFPKLSYVKKFAPWGWIIGSGIYIDDIDAGVQGRAAQNLVLLLGTSAVLLLLASLIARSITHPLKTAMRTMNGIANGSVGLDQRVAVDGHSEIAELARNFNEMLGHIETRDQALLQHQHDLEDEVASRTASLREANLQLDAELSERKLAERALQENLEYVRALNEQLENTQNQLLQSEKMASIGQLAAGVAHEINNPIGFVSSNLGTLRSYVDDLLRIIEAYDKADPLLAGHPEIHAAIETLKEQADLEFMRQDIQFLFSESRDGIDRVTMIVKNLKDFSRIDCTDWEPFDLEEGLDSTLNIVWNQLKTKAVVAKEYGGVPPIEGLGSQLNQVFMNLLLNAAQAIDGHGTITIRTGATDSTVWAEIADTGKGISPENQKRIFEPFFTTRAIGEGTGLGLSLAYSIIRKHHGTLEVVSEVGAGSCFRMEIPQRQPEASRRTPPTAAGAAEPPEAESLLSHSEK